MELDVIVVLLVIIAFCIGGSVLIKKANEDIKNQNWENNQLDKNTKNKK